MTVIRAKQYRSGKTYIKLTEEVRYNDHTKLYYAPGFRWIATKQDWSSNELIHCLQEYSMMPEGFEPDQVIR